MIAITSTEKLLQQAQLICKTVTQSPEVNNQLLCAVFERLCLENDIVETHSENNPESPSTLH